MNKSAMFCHHRAFAAAAKKTQLGPALIPAGDLHAHIRWPGDPPVDVDMTEGAEFADWCDRLPVRLAPAPGGWGVDVHRSYIPTRRKCHIFRDVFLSRPVSAAHPVIEVLTVYSGACECAVGGRKIDLTPGDFLFIAPGTEHAVTHSGRDDIVFSIHIHPDVLRTAFFSSLFRSRGLTRFILDGDAPFFLVPGAPAKYLMRLIKQLLYACNLDEGPDEPIADTILPYCSLILSHAVIMNVYSGDTFQEHSRDKFTYLHLIRAYVRDNYRTATLEELSRQLHLSKNYACTLIRSLTGKSFSEYLRSARMTEACQLLSRTDMSISAVAEAVGYSDSAYFIRLFREEYSMSPAGYRRGDASM